MPNLRRVALPAALAVFLLTLLPLGVGFADAATGGWTANCDLNVRSQPTTLSTRKARLARGTIVTASGKVTGGSYGTTCGKTVYGKQWLVITAIGGKSVKSLYGVSKVYAASALFRATATSSPSPYRYGVDISQWNGVIDFRKVRDSGRQFVIARATAGRLTTDSTYARNRRGALAAGLAFTAYHFANPDRMAGDARLEADHFIAVAQLRHGMLVPALDLEVGSRLGPARLNRWVRTWLERVHDRLGVKPMIYTTQSFWQTAMGDTSWFVKNGYKVLWIAHWDTTYPRVPADRWGGYSWSIWQYSDCGHVPGIPSRCVDLDKFHGPDLSVITW